MTYFLLYFEPHNILESSTFNKMYKTKVVKIYKTCSKLQTILGNEKTLM